MASRGTPKESTLESATDGREVGYLQVKVPCYRHKLDFRVSGLPCQRRQPISKHAAASMPCGAYRAQEPLRCLAGAPPSCSDPCHVHSGDWPDSLHVRPVPCAVLVLKRRLLPSYPGSASGIRPIVAVIETILLHG